MANDDARAQAEDPDEMHVDRTYRQVDEPLPHRRSRSIKMHPLHHDYEIRGDGVAIFAFAAEFGATVLTHCGCPGSHPEDFIPFADRHPHARVILAHIGDSAARPLGEAVRP